MRRLSKMQADLNRAVASTVKLATEEPDELLPAADVVTKYLADIGRRGGIKGGKARAAALSSERKREIAQKAARARWNREIQ